MAQILFEDKIGLLSESAGTITLAPSILTIGGQQYTTSSLNIAADLSTDNALYFLYAIESAGVVSLVTSENVNSLGPVGEVVWKLVGAYYSGQSSSFGSFVTIEGKPKTSNGIFTQETFAGGAAVNEVTTEFQRNGKIMEISGSFRFTAIPAASTGMRLPSPYTIDVLIPYMSSNHTTFGTALRMEPVGSQRAIGHDTNANIVAFVLNTSLGTNNLMLATRSRGTDPPRYEIDNYTTIFGSTDRVVILDVLRIPIDGWNDTPLKDL